MGRVNIFRQVLTEKGWRNAALERDEKGRIKWPSRGRFLIEWRESGRRKREAAGETPSRRGTSASPRRSDDSAKPMPHRRAFNQRRGQVHVLPSGILDLLLRKLPSPCYAPVPQFTFAIGEAMPLLKICVSLEGGRRLCVHIQGRSLRPPVLPPSPDLIDIDGKQPAWARDLETLATVQEVASDASPALKKMLTETVARGVKEVSGQLPAGVKVSSEA